LTKGLLIRFGKHTIFELEALFSRVPGVIINHQPVSHPEQEMGEQIPTHPRAFFTGRVLLVDNY
jgi:hypothetical protein